MKKRIVGMLISCIILNWYVKSSLLTRIRNEQKTIAAKTNQQKHQSKKPNFSSAWRTSKRGKPKIEE